MVKREKYLVTIVIILFAVVILLVVLPRGKEHNGNAGESKKSVSGESENSMNKMQKASKGKNFSQSVSSLDVEIKALKKELAELKVEVDALKEDPISEDGITRRLNKIDWQWRTRSKLSDDIKELDPEKSFKLFTSVWPTLTTDDQKNYWLSVFSRSQHPRILDIFDYGINDPSLNVQTKTLGFLSYNTLYYFDNDLQAYKEWREHTKEMSFEEAKKFNIAVRLKEAAEDDDALGKLLEEAPRSNYRDYLPADTMLALCENCIEERSPKAVGAALRYLRAYQRENELSEEYLRALVLPILTDPDELLKDNGKVRDAAIYALGSKNNLWATDILIDFLDQEVENGKIKKGSGSNLASAIGEMKNYAAIPKLIEIMKNDPENTNYAIGYYGLSGLTGVSYDESHDAEWWKAWWERNKSRFQINEEDKGQNEF